MGRLLSEYWITTSTTYIYPKQVDCMCRLKADVTQSNEANASVAPKVQVAGSWQANKNVQVKVTLSCLRDNDMDP